MEDLFKKVLYTGVGLVAFASEKIQQTVDELVKENKISSEEGKKIVDNFLNSTEAKKDEFEGKLKSLTDEVVTKFNFNKKTDLNSLVARIEAIEAKLGLGEEVEVEVEATAEA